MSLGTLVIDGLDVAARLAMRARTWVAPVGIGTTFFGAKILCDTRDFIQRRIYYFGIYEPNFTHYIAQRLKAGDVVVDVGANVGYVTLLASNLVGLSGRVIAIEAFETTFQSLQSNLERNRAHNVQAINMAATEGPCELEVVQKDERNIGGAQVRPAEGCGTKVKGDSLSAILGAQTDSVALIKIDIEGSEGPVLEHLLGNLGAFTNLRSIVVEITDPSVDYVEKLCGAGFRAYGLPNNYRIGYLMVRHYLSRTGEGAFVVKTPVDHYSSQYTDYVFER